MKALVTGGAGFIGSHLVDRLVEMHHEVTVYDNLNTGNRDFVHPLVRFYEVSVENINPTYHHDDVYDVIFHLAGEARIQPSFINPILTHNANVTGTVKMLELARKCRAKFVYAGSSSVYHDMYANPYSFTKLMAEHYCTLYHQIYHVPVAIARFFNVYGPRQIEEGAYATVIGVFEKQRREGQELTITGTGEQRRDFTHVADIVDGLILLSQTPWQSQIFNLGTGENFSINEVADMFRCPAKHVPKRPGEAWITKADTTLIRTLGWQPQHRLPDYIREIIG